PLHGPNASAPTAFPHVMPNTSLLITQTSLIICAKGQAVYGAKHLLQSFQQLPPSLRRARAPFLLLRDSSKPPLHKAQLVSRLVNRSLAARRRQSPAACHWPVIYDRILKTRCTFEKPSPQTLHPMTERFRTVSDCGCIL